MIDFLNNYEDMTESERKVLNYVVNNREVIPMMKINDLAEATYVSKTVIINLAQKLGYSGFGEMKYRNHHIIKEEMTHRQSDDLSFRNTLQHSIDKTFSIVTDEMIHNCAKKILSSTTAFIMERGTSKALVYYFQ